MHRLRVVRARLSARSAIGVAAAFGLGACAPGVEVTALPEYIVYSCKDGKKMEVARAPDGLRAAVRFEGQTIELRRTDSAAQEKYSNGPDTLYLDGERAALESQGRIVTGACLTTQPLPTYFRQR